MDWETALQEAREELGYSQSQYIKNWNELIEKAHEIQDFANDMEKQDRSFEGKINHQEYLKSERWKNLRLEILKRDKYICQDCLKICSGSLVKKATEVHHLTYASLGTDNEKNDCISLCENHHKKRHNLL